MTFAPRMQAQGLAWHRIAVSLLLICLPGASLAQVCYSPFYQYENQIALTHADDVEASLVRLPPVRNHAAPWWETGVQQQLRRSGTVYPVTLDDLILKAIDHSAQVKVFSDLPLIRETAIVEADAAFDWTAFMETRWDDLSDPVGNTLTVGPGANRYENHDWFYNQGVRKRNRWGGNLEVGQRIGHQNTNSQFFRPNNQGTSRLVLNYTQPLCRGKGYYYNTSIVVLAEIDADVALDEFERQLQSHLLEVTRAYWGLYLERGGLLQKQRLHARAQAILADLEAREGVDAAANQVIRVRAAVAERLADLVRAEAAVRNAQDRILALVNDPDMAMVEQLELIPTELLSVDEPRVSTPEALTVALQQRPEINQALKQIQAASVRTDMANHEVLPRLDLVLETYVAGLRGNSNIGGALSDQFNTGDPGYSIGLQFEMPLHRRAAFARLERRQLELRQLENQLRSTCETLMLEVKVAVREVNTAYRETQAKQHSMWAAGQQLETIRTRWQHLPGEDRSVALYLEDLLAAQERLTTAEFGYLKAQSTYNLALVNLKRATGTLLGHEGISHGVACVDCLPMTIIDKQLYGDQPDGPIIHAAPSEVIPTPGADGQIFPPPPTAAP